MERRDPTVARGYFQKGLEKTEALTVECKNDWRVLRVLIGRAYFLEREHKQSIYFLNESIEIFNQSEAPPVLIGRVFFQLGQSYAELSQFESALNCFQQAQQLLSGTMFSQDLLDVVEQTCRLKKSKLLCEFAEKARIEFCATTPQYWCE